MNHWLIETNFTGDGIVCNPEYRGQELEYRFRALRSGVVCYEGKCTTLDNYLLNELHCDELQSYENGAWITVS